MVYLSVVSCPLSTPRPAPSTDETANATAKASIAFGTCVVGTSISLAIHVKKPHAINHAAVAQRPRGKEEEAEEGEEEEEAEEEEAEEEEEEEAEEEEDK